MDQTNRLMTASFIGGLALAPWSAVLVTACADQRSSTSLVPALTLDQPRRERIDAIFADYDTSTRPGCMLGIMSGGRTIYARGYGLATLDPIAAIDSTNLFDLGSDTKQFTAAAVLLLAQQGALQLTDDVRDYVPELPTYGARITLNHLLWHTSGLRDYVTLLGLAGYDDFEPTTQALALEVIARQRSLDFPTGSRYAYSNSGYVLLAQVIERVTGQTLNSFMREQIFDPLDMRTAVFRHRQDPPIPNLALGYAADDVGGFEVAIGAWEQFGDGALHLSMEEAQKWDENFFTGQVGGASFAREMYRRGQLDDGRALDYASGLQVGTYRGLERVMHGGDGIGYHSQIVRFPEQHTSVALFCNDEGINHYDLSTRVVDVVLEEAFTQPEAVEPAPLPSLAPERLVGHYASRLPEHVFAVTQEDGTLGLQFLFATLPLIPTGTTTFEVEGFPRARLEFLVEGEATAYALRLTLAVDDRDTAPIDAERFTPTNPTDLGQFAGRFHSPELGVYWTLAVEDEKLELAENATQILESQSLARTVQRVLPISGPLDPGMTDSFYGAPGVLTFTRDPSGQVNGFGMSYNGMRDIRFDLTD
jgi:CubicO group peptidase (beta-lactamase class C family)